jgi:hypothetical protein
MKRAYSAPVLRTEAELTQLTLANPAISGDPV